MLKANLLANFIGQAWTALMGVLFVPIYIKYIGIEAYGLVGAFAILTASLTILDLGISPTVSRELARAPVDKGHAAFARDLLRTAEIISATVSLGLFLTVTIISTQLQGVWINTNQLNEATVDQALLAAGVVLSLRLPEGVYRGILIGIQRQVSLNVVSCIFATIRGLGALAVLKWISPTVEAFLAWQAITSAMTLITLGVLAYATLPDSKSGGRFSRKIIYDVRAFASGMIKMSVLTFIVTQADKLLLTAILPLEAYGYYAVAVLISSSLHTLMNPIVQAWYPRACQLHASGASAALVHAYHCGAQMVSAVIGTIAAVVIIFSTELIMLWSRDPLLTANSAPLVALLTAGVLLNCFMWIPHQLQLAFGWTSLANKMNILAIAVTLPALYVFVPIYGVAAAGWTALFVNAAYLLLGSRGMFKKILSDRQWYWYWHDLVVPTGVAVTVVAAAKLLAPAPSNIVETAITLSCTTTFALICAVIATPDLRRLIVEHASRWRIA
jgi:O-antigen/teichoic acid export membrane protein